MRTKKKTRTSQNERGASLIIALMALLVLSLLATGIFFVVQTEILTTANYRELAQARYAAEAGVQSTINWLANNYTAPTNFALYNTSTDPVQCATGCTTAGTVVLSAVSGVSSNYPDSTVTSAYNTALSSQTLPGLPNASYSTYATLVAMTPGGGVSWLGGGVAMQTGQITSRGKM